jgi:hypothetical protein
VSQANLSEVEANTGIAGRAMSQHRIAVGFHLLATMLCLASFSGRIGECSISVWRISDKHAGETFDHAFQ